MTHLQRIPTRTTTPARFHKTVAALGPTRGTVFVGMRGGAVVVRVAGVDIVSAFPLAKLERMGATRARYDAACARAASLYTAEKTDLWRLACDHAKALSRTLPLTVAKKDKDGRYVVPEWDA